MVIIDTNVLIDYPGILEQDDILGIAWPVLEELDKLKITKGERARKARIVLKRLKSLLENKNEKSNINFIYIP